MNVHFGSLIPGNAARCINGFVLGIIRPCYFVGTRLPHSPLALLGNDMLSFSWHFFASYNDYSDKYAFIPVQEDCIHNP